MTADQTRYPSVLESCDFKPFALSFVGAILLEAALIFAVLHVPKVETPIEKPRPIMQAQIVKPAPPPPPPPLPVVKKVVKHLEPHAAPKPVQKRPSPPPPKAAPSVDTPTVPAVQTPVTNTQPAPSVSPPANGSAKSSAEPADIAIECPVQVKPTLPPKAIAEGITGEVTARATIRAGQVISVDIVRAQPPRVFDDAVRQAMRRYQCRTNGNEAVVVEQTFDFSSAD